LEVIIASGTDKVSTF